MNKKRMKVQEYILKLMSDVDSTGRNSEYYQERFAEMTDKKFDTWMRAIRDKKEVLAVFMGAGDRKVSMNELISLAKSRKVKVFEKIRIQDKFTKKPFLSKYNAMILQLPIRRLSQHIAHKISLPESDTHVNPATGQVIPPDKGAKLSMVEATILGAKGLEITAIELMKVRGGDLAAYYAAKYQIEEEGSLSIESLPLENRPRSAVTAKILFQAIGIDTNI